jgi:LmbE family N-acetylglucosaminyl deacetylase
VRVAGLPAARSVLAVCAHPDDESFGLGAVLAGFSRRSSSVAVVCFTHGEASTLGAAVPSLGELRARELAEAAEVLGVSPASLLDYPDGRLAEVAEAELATRVADAAHAVRADLLVGFDEGGVTGHPDHEAATAAARRAAAALLVPVLAWTLPEDVASALNTEFGTRFVGRPSSEIDLVVRVERDLQRQAIACHESQSRDNPVLWRRLELLGDREHLRWLWRPAPSVSSSDAA